SDRAAMPTARPALTSVTALRVEARSRGGKGFWADRPVGKMWTVWISAAGDVSACTAPPSHSQGLLLPPESGRKYNTTRGCIQAKCLCLLSKPDYSAARRWLDGDGKNISLYMRGTRRACTPTSRRAHSSKTMSLSSSRVLNTATDR